MENQRLTLKEENKKWLEFLCNTEENNKKYLKKYINTKSLVGSLMNFRRDLFEIGRGQALTKDELNLVIKEKDKIKLKTMLSELFLEYISSEEINYIDSAINNGLSADEIISLHRENKEMRIGTFIVSYKNLLKRKHQELPKAI